MLPMEESKFSLFLIFLSGLIFFLLFLGLIKGMLGLYCWDKIGMYGLNLLIDLPRPLSRYQEKELEHRQVIYDIGGWPVHPDTQEKTVRALPKRTEFCLNLIFFLAYPLAAIVYICAFCCCIKNYSKVEDSSCFKHVDVVRLMNQEPKNGKKGGGNKNRDVYNNDDKEERDTRYVREQMRKSKESIHNNNTQRGDAKICACHTDEAIRAHRINLKTCACHPDE